jgi:2-oxoglutarate ferredoxin oxidoreductase subunit gamma
MDRQIRFSGFGGQGVILMGIVLARAASLYEKTSVDFGHSGGKQAIQTQSYGPSARGGHSKCDVKISDHQMLYPFVEVPDDLIIMSQQAYLKYIDDRSPDTRVIIDPDLVLDRPDGDFYEIAATKAAEELGTRIVANIVMLGAFREMSNIVSRDALEKALFDSLPPATHELNKKALSIGAGLGRGAQVKRAKS